jgi:hypothetical protein
MTPEEIHNHCISLGAKPPKVVEYANGTLVVLRNGDGARVATIIDNTLRPEQIKERLAGLYKIKAGNQASQETLDKVFPRKSIQEHQEAKKSNE